MTYQPPPTPVGYASPNQPLRPTSVTVLAIIGIVLASLGLLSSICGGVALIMSSSMDLASEMSAPEVAMQESTLWTGYSIFSYVAGLAMAALLMYGSIGSLSLKPGARKAMLLYAKLAIAFAILGIIMTLVILLPIARPHFSSSDPAEVAGAWGGVIGGLLGALLGVIYPIFVLIFFRKPRVAAAFGESGDGYIHPYMQQPYGQQQPTGQTPQQPPPYQPPYPRQ